MKKSFYIKTADEMEKLGRCLAEEMKPDDVIHLKGVLGAGKTTLIRGLARGLGFKGRVHSPTFTLMNIYSGRLNLYHLDFYRLASADIAELGLEDYMEAGGVTAVEWAELGQEILPPATLTLEINLVDEDYERERHVCLEGDGKFTALFERLESLADFSC